ncbi:MAG: hypothetical protein AAGA99_25165 [Actinomycetota bacterium]
MLRTVRTLALGLLATGTLLVALIGGPVQDDESPAAPATPVVGR